jgi:hypothetical protein
VSGFKNKKAKEMKTYITKGFEYFYDTIQKQWVLYPIDNLCNRIEWDDNDNPIEVKYFNNRKELNKWLLNQNTK